VPPGRTTCPARSAQKNKKNKSKLSDLLPYTMSRAAINMMNMDVGATSLYGYTIIPCQKRYIIESEIIMCAAFHIT